MRILGVDSSGMVASVALVEDDLLVAEYSVNYKKTHSQTLLPMLDEIVKMTELDLNTIDAIAVAAGPGSFTGLRIGAATVKGLGLALEKPVISVPTCHGLAYNLWGSDKLICPIMDARRSQVYTGIYEFAKDGMQVLLDQSAMDIRALAEKLNAMGRDLPWRWLSGLRVCTCRMHAGTICIRTGTPEPPACVSGCKSWRRVFQAGKTGTCR